MAAPLGSLRRVLPLTSRLVGAPGVLREYSDLASGVPGRGRGGGGHAGADGSSEAPGSRSGNRQFFERSLTPSSIQETAPADSRYEEAEEPQQQRNTFAVSGREPARRAAGSAAAAAAGAAAEAGGAAGGQLARRRRSKGGGRMSRLVAGTGKEREDEDEEEGDDGEAAVAEAAPRRERRMGSRPAEDGLNPREALAEWLVELPDLAQPGKVGATLPAADLLTYEELGMDPSRLWLLKYVLGPSTLARLQQGAVGAEELDEIADKLLVTMIPSSQEQEGQTRQYLQTNWDPHYRLMDGVGETPGVGPGVGRSRKARTAGAMMDEFKEELMDMMQMDEEEFEWHKREAAQEWDLVRKAVHFNLPKDQEDRVERLFARSVPANHPMYGTIRSKLDVVQSNAQWPGDRKLVFAKRLIKTLTGAQQL